MNPSLCRSTHPHSCYPTSLRCKHKSEVYSRQAVWWSCPNYLQTPSMHIICGQPFHLMAQTCLCTLRDLITQLSSATYVREPLMSTFYWISCTTQPIKLGTLIFFFVGAMPMTPLVLTTASLLHMESNFTTLHDLQKPSVSYFFANHFQQLNTPVACAMYTASN